MIWFKIHNQRITLSIFAKPHAKKTTILKVDGEGLHVAIHAKPHEGEANKELISYLAEIFQLPKSQVILQRGGNSRHKVIELPLSSTVYEFLDDPMLFVNR